MGSGIGKLAGAGTLAAGLAMNPAADAGIMKVDTIIHGVPTSPEQVIFQIRVLREEIGGVLEDAPIGGGFGVFTVDIRDINGVSIPLSSSQISSSSLTFTHTFAYTGVANGFEWLMLGAGGDIKGLNLFQDGEVEIARAILDLGIPVGSVSIGVGGGEGTFRDQQYNIMDVNAVQYTVTDASQVPAPGSLALLAAGAAGAAGAGAAGAMRRRSSRSDEEKERQGAPVVEGTV